MRDTGQYLPPWLLQALGAIIIIAAIVFWMVTGQQSALVVGAGVSLVGLGAYSGLRINVTKEPRPENEEEQPDIGDLVGRLPE